MLHPEEHVPPLRLNEALGGLVHPGIDLPEGACVLAVGREVGDWLRELAQCYPQHHLVHVQTSISVVQVGARTGRKQWANMTYTSVQDVLQIEDKFAPEAFELICVHFCAGEVPLQQFPALMQSLLHLCKEQGQLVWLEADLPVTCDDACEKLAWLLIAALQARGDMVSCLSIPQVGIGAWMEWWLHDAGWNILQHISSRASVSAGEPLHDLFTQQMHHFAPHLHSLSAAHASGDSTGVRRTVRPSTAGDAEQGLFRVLPTVQVRLQETIPLAE
ncbi:MAG: hypothetical protein JO125_09770 [Chloroflexi bacterium]|nr:hypothetical protein [Chloroflexota bacterium]